MFESIRKILSKTLHYIYKIYKIKVEEIKNRDDLVRFDARLKSMKSTKKKGEGGGREGRRWLTVFEFKKKLQMKNEMENENGPRSLFVNCRTRPRSLPHG